MHRACPFSLLGEKSVQTGRRVCGRIKFSEFPPNVFHGSTSSHHGYLLCYPSISPTMEPKVCCPTNANSSFTCRHSGRAVGSGQRHERRYLSTHSIRSIIALNVLPRNESAYDVDARRIDNDARIACRHQMRPGWKAPFGPTNGAFSTGALPVCARY
jgi:hypothetical protein